MEELKNDVMATDRAFSALSDTEGTTFAFVSYAHDEGVILRDNSMPIVGRQAITDAFFGFPGSNKLTWEPQFCDVAESGDLAYTYGTYELVADTTITRGTYVSIWKKNEQGDWKFVLDTGNEGLGLEN